jgi:hypothetical protein
MPLSEEAAGVRGRRVLAGEGMLVATVDGFFVDEFGRHEIKAGITRIAADHPLARQRPEVFRVCWRKDVETAMRHRSNLLERMKELGGGKEREANFATPERAPVKPTTRPAWWLG